MGRKKRFKAEIQVRYHDQDAAVRRSEQLINVTNVDEQDDHDNYNVDVGDGAEDFDVSDEPAISSSVSLNTHHYERLQRAEDAWAKLRQAALSTTFHKEGSFLNSNRCHFCDSESGICRCLDCSATAQFCEVCATSMHTKVNILHRVEILKEGNIYFPLILTRTLVLNGHQCPSTHFRNVSIVDSRGFQVVVAIQFCSCEPDFLRLLRFNFWGATPTKPELAFTMDLMKLLHTLNLECQVAVKDFCSAIQTLVDDMISFPNQRKLYPVLIDSLEEFRIYSHRLSSMKFATSETNELDCMDCPACPKNQGSLPESMDALFIGRKKSAGRSVRSPLFGTAVFYNDSDVEEFVQQHPTTSRAKEACGDFLAGDAIRSRSRYSALSETAIFGRACRHEFPKKFINMKHGERLAYPVWMLNNLLNEINGRSLDVCILYDIACLLETHLKAQGHRHILQSVQLAIPIFHSYGHKASCQIKYSPRRIPGFGLTDGEVLERLWSFLRRFGKMTKEMRPNHRIDVLSDALLFYSKKKTASIGVINPEPCQGRTPSNYDISTIDRYDFVIKFKVILIERRLKKGSIIHGKVGRVLKQNNVTIHKGRVKIWSNTESTCPSLRTGNIFLIGGFENALRRKLLLTSKSLIESWNEGTMRKIRKWQKGERNVLTKIQGRRRSKL